MKLHGGIGWLLLVAFVIYWDLYHHTLSDAFWSALTSPRWRFPVMVAWAVLTAHLFDVLNPRYDPIRWIGRLLGIALRRKVGQ